jgi:3-hydroxyisobutyrate dehydrogenase
MTKLVNQMVGASTLAAVAEGVVLAAAARLEPAAMIRALSGGAAASWMLAELAPRMQRGDFTPGFMVRLRRKDLRLALAAAAEPGSRCRRPRLLTSSSPRSRPGASARSVRRRS